MENPFSVIFAYPNSKVAEQLGKPEGCWVIYDTVIVGRYAKTTLVGGPYPTKQAAYAERYKGNPKLTRL